jgi:PAS domain-containing protein
LAEAHGPRAGKRVDERRRPRATEPDRGAFTAACYQAAFERHPCPTWVFDLETKRLVAVNEAAETAWGYSGDRDPGFSLDEVGSPLDPRGWSELMTCSPGQMVRLGECHQRKRDGRHLDLETACCAASSERTSSSKPPSKPGSGR